MLKVYLMYGNRSFQIKPSSSVFKTQEMKQDGSLSDKYELSLIVVPSINRSGYFGYQPEIKQVNQLANALENAPVRPYVRIVTNVPYFRYLRKISSVTYSINLNDINV
uniref:Uncharacterized protein n=1 Tax=Cacopsylla melanoneura TaxID=428564 RepID=A0A8D8ZGB5_9HEMI